MELRGSEVGWEGWRAGGMEGEGRQGQREIGWDRWTEGGKVGGMKRWTE